MRADSSGRGCISAVGAIRLHAARCGDTQYCYRGLGQRHPTWFARFHPCRWHRPYTAFKIDLIPPHAASFAASSRSEDGQLKAERPGPVAKRGEFGRLLPRQRGVVGTAAIGSRIGTPSGAKCRTLRRQDRQSVVLCRRRDDDVGHSRCLALSARPVRQGAGDPCRRAYRTRRTRSP